MCKHVLTGQNIMCFGNFQYSYALTATFLFFRFHSPVKLCSFSVSQSLLIVRANAACFTLSIFLRAHNSPVWLLLGSLFYRWRKQSTGRWWGSGWGQSWRGREEGTLGSYSKGATPKSWLLHERWKWAWEASRMCQCAATCPTYWSALSGPLRSTPSSTFLKLYLSLFPTRSAPFNILFFKEYHYHCCQVAGTPQEEMQMRK